MLLSALGEVSASPRLEADTTSLSSEDYEISIKLNLTSALKSYKKYQLSQVNILMDLAQLAH